MINKGPNGCENIPFVVARKKEALVPIVVVVVVHDICLLGQRLCLHWQVFFFFPEESIHCTVNSAFQNNFLNVWWLRTGF